MTSRVDSAPRNPKGDLSIHGLCSELDISKSKAYRLKQSGEIEGYRLGPYGAWRFSRQSIDAFKQKYREAGRPE